MKRCCRCKKHKPPEDYRVRAQSTDGRTSQCRLCLRRGAAYRKAHGVVMPETVYKYHEPHETLGTACSYLLGLKL